MILFLFSVLFMICSFSLYSFTYRVNGVSRVITYTPPTIFEIAVPLTSDDEEPNFYFEREALKEKHKQYLDSSLSRYVDSYEVDYYFYNPNNNGVCEIDDCKGVEITFKTQITDFYKYENTMYYEIKKVG